MKKKKRNKKAVLSLLSFLLAASFVVQPAYAATCNTNSVTFVKSSSEYASISNNAGITGGNISIEAWVKPASTPSGGQVNTVVYQGSTTNRDAYLFWYWDNGGSVTLSAIRDRGGVGDSRASVVTTLSTSNWTHIVLTYDGTNIKLFTAAVAGSHTQQASTAASGVGTNFDTDKISIGADFEDGASSPARYFDGEVDDVRVWNTVLTTTDMDNSFQTELVGNETGLVAYYTLNNNYNDTTSNAYNLTAVNSPTFTTDVPFTGSCGGAAPVRVPDLPWFFWLNW